ncbi:MAG: hypothetical protein RIA09_15745 [Hoeflea sp.]|jgi:hypothetical protein|uniref:hypothetical protein n=1 Tax=Hoeflea sp. TaxID=1940281 RepID=UPI0032EDA6E4
MTGPTTPHEPVIREVASEAATQAITELFLKLGIDVNNPLEVQRDMQALRELGARNADPLLRQDMLYLRELRMTSERIKSRTLLGFVAFLVTGTLSALAVGLKSFLSPD